MQMTVFSRMPSLPRGGGLLLAQAALVIRITFSEFGRTVQQRRRDGDTGAQETLVNISRDVIFKVR